MVDADPEVLERIAGIVLSRLKRDDPPPVEPSPIPIEWFTPEEAGAYLRLTSKALEHLRGDGAGPKYHKYSGRIRYHIGDLRAWALSHRGASQ